jgi:hypothetical protein
VSETEQRWFFTPHKLLETANIKLANVVSDVLGVSGRAMLDALVAGETDPEHLAKLARGSLVPESEPLAQELRGRFTSNHAFLLGQMLTQLEFRRISKRRGPKRAGIAVAHNILVIAYHMLRNGVDFRRSRSRLL